MHTIPLLTGHPSWPQAYNIPECLATIAAGFFFQNLKTTTVPSMKSLLVYSSKHRDQIFLMGNCLCTSQCPHKTDNQMRRYSLGDLWASGLSWLVRIKV